jgi:hypothetical protein
MSRIEPPRARTSGYGWLAQAIAAALACRALLALILGWWGAQSPFRMPPDGHRFYHDVPRVTSTLGDLCVRWDSYWYLNIVRDGYRPMTAGESNTAFLPAYPWLVRWLATTGLPPAVVGVLLSTACFVVLLLLAGLYAHDRLGPDGAALTVIYLSVFPSSWVFSMVYAEALFCAALFAAFVLYHRERYLLAGVCGAAAVVTRAAGLALLAALFLDILLRTLRQRRLPTGPLCTLAGAAAGVLLLASLYAAISGNALGFLEQTRGWSTHAEFGDSQLPLLASLGRDIQTAQVQAYLPFLVIYGIAVALAVWRYRDLASIYCGLAVLMLLGLSYFSQLRYLLPLLPAHVLIVDVLVRRPWGRFALPVLAAVQVVITRFYLDWLFVI